MQLFQIIVPFVFTYVLINEMNSDNIESFMKIALWVTTVGYLAAVIANLNSLTSVFNVSIFSSYSPFENSTYAEIASGLAAYFIYFRKKMPRYAFIAVVLNFLIFKRVLMLMAIILLIISLQGKQDEEVSKRMFKISVVSWILLIVSTYFLYQPETAQMLKSRYNIDLASFTMARIYRLWYVYETNFISYGLGSTQEYINSQRLSYLGFDFEMDFIRIMFELGIVAIIVFVYLYLSITKRNKYAFYLINLCFINLLMANGLLKYWGWTVRLVTIALINYNVNTKNTKGGEVYSK